MGGTHHVFELEADVGAGVDAQRRGQAEQPRQRLDAQPVEHRLALLELHVGKDQAQPVILWQFVRCLRPARPQGLSWVYGMALPPALLVLFSKTQ